MLAFGLGLACGRGGRLPVASVFDFSAGVLPAGASFRRASTALFTDAGGQLAIAAIDQPRFDHDAAGVPLGLLITRQRTNKCTNANANPVDRANVVKTGDAAATLALVDDRAALVAAGLGAICPGKVYRLDNSAGTALAYAVVSGSAGETASQTVSAYVRGGAGRLTLNAGAVPTNFAAAPAYVKRTAAVLPDQSYRTMAIAAEPGSTLYFILNALVSGDALASPIITTGQAATQSADVLTLDWHRFGLADGAITARYSFDDGSAQDVVTTVSGGLSIVPTNLNRPWIKQVEAL